MTNKIMAGNALTKLKELPSGAADCCVTSPPYYGLRDYGHDEQLGQEKSPEKYISNLVAVFREVKRVLKDDGTLWVNIADSYAGSGKRSNTTKQGANIGAYLGALPKTATSLKPKNLMGIPWRLAFALQADGWYLRQDIIWHKTNAMPESVKDRCTNAHEYLFLLSKSKSYYYDYESIKEPAVTFNSAVRDRSKSRLNQTPGRTNVSGLTHSNYKYRNKRDVWGIPTSGFKGAHFSTYPIALIEPCILAGSRVGGVVLDPFIGSGTTGIAALMHGRKYIGIELNDEYVTLANQRIIDSGECVR